jgi:ubiquinone/menaquinone biosynthesis C-methylase UbiE
MVTNLDRYERIAPLYDWLDLPFEYGRYRHIRPLLFQELSGRILDAGVGTGRNFPFYPPGSHVVGIDFSPAMLACAKRRAGLSSASIELKEMNAVALDFPDRSFDAAVATFLFCVLPDDQQLAALRELGRIVKNGGIIRILNYVLPQQPFRRAVAKLWEPWMEWAFGAGFDRRTEDYVAKAGLQLLDSPFVVHDLIRLVSARVPAS